MGEPAGEPVGPASPPRGPATPPNRTAEPRPAVLVPVKRFDDAKHRLAGVLDDSQRARLAQAMVRQVLSSATGLSTFIVADHPSVVRWAQDIGAKTIQTVAVGLNPSVTEAVGSLDAERFSHALIAHGDLPQARSLGGLCRAGAVTIVTDRHLDGTNVLAVPLGCGFRFHYGTGSLQAHTAEAFRCGLGVQTKRVAELQLDVDYPEDLADAADLLAKLNIALATHG